MPSPPRILLTGATGYIGGTILTSLLATPTPSFALPITCLIRSPSAAATLTSTYGATHIRPLLYAGLDDQATATAAAAQHADIVINAALGYHAGAALALLRGLAASTTGGREPWYVHLSGTSNLGDRSVSGAWVEPQRVFDDDAQGGGGGGVHAWERRVEGLHPYVQRGAEIAVVDEGVALGVRTVVVMPPMVWGRGTGVVGRRQSTQVPAYVKAARARGRAVVMGDGRGAWDHVHVEDLAGLYGVLVERVAVGGGEGVPWGREGVVFAADGRQTWREVAEAVAEVGVEGGWLREGEVEEVSVEEGTRIFAEVYLGDVDGEMVELGLASHGKTVPSVARRLGWKPTRGGEEAWRMGLREDVKAAFETS